MIRRREFIAGLGSAAAWPMVARAQRPAIPVIGFLLPQSAGDYKPEIVTFFQSLKEGGFVGGQNVAVEYRYAEKSAARAPSRSRPPPCGGDRSRWRHRSGAGEGGDRDHTHRLCQRR